MKRYFADTPGGGTERAAGTADDGAAAMKMHYCNGQRLCDVVAITTQGPSPLAIAPLFNEPHRQGAMLAEFSFRGVWGKTGGGLS